MLFRTSIQTIWLTLCAIWLSLLLTLLLLEVHVSMVHDSTGKLVDAHLLFTGEAQNVNSILEGQRKFTLNHQYIMIFKFNPFSDLHLWHQARLCHQYWPQ